MEIITSHSGDIKSVLFGVWVGLRKVKCPVFYKYKYKFKVAGVFSATAPNGTFWYFEKLAFLVYIHTHVFQIFI